MKCEAGFAEVSKMPITPEDLKEFDLPYAQVWARKHDYMPVGYTLMNVIKLQDGYEGSMTLPHLPYESAVFAVKTETFAKCCESLEQQFWVNVPDHKCGDGCFDWHGESAVLCEPSGRTQ